MAARITLRELLATGYYRLAAGVDPETASLDAELLAVLVLKETRPRLLAHPEWFVSALSSNRYDRLVEQRALGMPLAYLRGHQEFYGRNFIVRPSVLVPRPESELLVELALGQLREGDQVLDIGAGSGCLGLSVGLERPGTPVGLLDSSQRALGVARLNTKRLRVTKVWFEHADLWPRRGHGLVAARTIVIANLPYVADADYHGRPPLRHEPSGALRGGRDGLRLIRRLLKRLKREAFEPKCLLLEVGVGQAAAVSQLATGPTKTFPDLVGVSRVVACYPASSR